MPSQNPDLSNPSSQFHTLLQPCLIPLSAALWDVLSSNIETLKNQVNAVIGNGLCFFERFVQSYIIDPVTLCINEFSTAGMQVGLHFPCTVAGGCTVL